MKITIHTSERRLGSFSRNSYNQNLKLTKTIAVGSLTITILEHKYAYYVGILKGKNFYCGGVFEKENSFNETPQQILDNLVKRIENLKVGDILIFYTEKFQELNGKNLTINQ